MVERSGLGWSLAFILPRVLLLPGRASTSRVMSYLASPPCPGCASREHQLLATVLVTILGNMQALGPHPFPHSFPTGLAGQEKSAYRAVADRLTIGMEGTLVSQQDRGSFGVQLVTAGAEEDVKCSHLHHPSQHC